MTYHTNTRQARARRAQIGDYVRGLTVLAILTAFCLGAWLVFASLIASAAGAYDSEQNQPGYWGDDCWKVEGGTGPAVYLDADYRLVVLKSGTVNDAFDAPRAGDQLVTRSGKDISHVIYCPEIPTTTTTEAPVATTLPPPTTAPPSTTIEPPAPTVRPPATVPVPTTQAPPDVPVAPPAPPVPVDPSFTG